MERSQRAREGPLGPCLLLLQQPSGHIFCVQLKTLRPLDAGPLSLPWTQRTHLDGSQPSSLICHFSLLLPHFLSCLFLILCNDENP